MKAQHWASFLAAAFAVLVFIKIAWVTDDAYIIFRSIEQLHAGNGPRWNPHERVQVFTSPLWFGCLALLRVFSANVFLNAIAASLLLFTAMLAVLRAALRDPVRWLVLIGLLVVSQGFFDYTTSGLENPLGYLLVAFYLYGYGKVFDSTRPCGRAVYTVAAVFGLALACRYDMATLLLIPTAYAAYACRGELGRSQRLHAAALAIGPAVAWAFFSLIYYGSVFPNTAYAKLGTGIPAPELWAQGIRYLYVCLRYDTITALFVVVATGILIASPRHHVRALGFGIAANVLYVVWVGGDFMLGRFLAFAYLVSVVSLLVYVPRVQEWLRGWRLVTVLAATVLYAGLYYHTPVNSPFEYRNTPPHPMGISDERGSYARGSLRRYLMTDVVVFPDHHWSFEGREFAASESDVEVRFSTGYFGYWAGTEKIVIDPLALSDPLLARLPADGQGPWRIGHFVRRIPNGYATTVALGDERIEDPSLREFHRKLRIVTQDEPLFSIERIRTIVALNLGAYDHLVRDYALRNR